MAAEKVLQRSAREVQKKSTTSILRRKGEEVSWNRE